MNSKPDYKSWMPKGMVLATVAGAAVCTMVFLTLLLLQAPSFFRILFLILTIVLWGAALWMFLMHRNFSYNGKRQMARQIIEGTADYIKDIPVGGKVLDVGCGSGALAIAAARRNPQADVLGVDRWGREYASFSKKLCEENAAAEGIGNVRFQKGDATKLDFPDESFDAVCSNYVYHNVTGANKQDLLMETLRVLKKGGTFVIHDIMSKSRYGDMQAFVRTLKSAGYEKVELIDTTDGKFMSKWEAAWMGLSGSTLLTGRK